MGDKTLNERVYELECGFKILTDEFCRFKVDAAPVSPIEPGGLRLVVEGLVERARLEDEKKARVSERMKKARAGRGRAKRDG